MKAGFEKRMVDWDKLNTLNQELSEKPLNVINPNYDAEIIRYEKLVEFIKDCITADSRHSVGVS